MSETLFEETKNFASVSITKDGDVITAVVENKYPFISLLQNKRTVMYMDVLRELGFIDEAVSKGFAGVSPCRAQTARMLCFDDGPQKFDLSAFLKMIYPQE